MVILKGMIRWGEETAEAKQLKGNQQKTYVTNHWECEVTKARELVSAG